MNADDLLSRVGALADALDVGGARLDGAEVDAARALVDKARQRLDRGSGWTIVALAGPTGAGKSTLFNALVGSERASTGVRRPTTTGAAAATWQDGADAVLEWLDVGRRHRIPARDGHEGLILLDLPDHDSIEVDHRRQVDRLVELVDVVVWVSDPEKYADQAMHAGFLQPFATHGAAFVFVLNHADRVPAADRDGVVADFRRLVVADGIADPDVRTTTAVTGVGVEDLRSVLVARATAERAALTRLDADLRRAAASLSTGSSGGGVPDTVVSVLRTGLEGAVGVDDVVAVSVAQYRRDGHQRTAWVPARWRRRWRRHPVRDLAVPSVGSSAGIAVEAALRDAAEAAGDELPASWARAQRHSLAGASTTVLAALDESVVGVARPQTARPRWWSAVDGVQRAVAAVATVGLVWLVVLAVAAGFLRLDADPLLVLISDDPEIPLPTALFLGGVLVGLLVHALAGAAVRAGAARQGRRARKRLHDSLDAVGEATVMPMLRSHRADLDRVETLLATAADE